MKKKLLFIIGGLIGGGAEKALLSLLKNLDYSEYEVDLLLLTKGANFPKDCPASVRTISFYGKYRNLNRLFFFLQKHFGFAWHTIPCVVRKKIGDKKYDVAISYLEGAAVLIHEKILSNAKRNISWIHSDFWNDHYSVPNYFKSEDTEFRAYSRMDEIVAVSRNAADALLRRYPQLSVPVSVMYNIIDVSASPQVSEMRSSCPKRKFTICSVGRLVPVKGFDRLVEVAKRFADAGYSLDFWIIGEGEERNALEQKISTLGLSENVFLLGYHPCPAEIISKCDIFVSTSVSEGLSLVICEAMTQKLPVISTNTSGASELLDGGKFGILTGHDVESIFEGIRRLVDDSGLRERFSELSGERVKVFETKKLLSVFEQIMEGSYENSSCD